MKIDIDPMVSAIQLLQSLSQIIQANLMLLKLKYSHFSK